MNEKTPLRELKGVGEKTEKLFQKIGITTTEELFRYYPRTYDIYEEPVEIASAEEDKTVSIRVTIATGIYISQVRNLQVLTTTVADASGRLPVAWFNAPLRILAQREQGDDSFLSLKIILAISVGTT